MARGKGSTPQGPSHREAVELFKRVDLASLALFIERVLPGSEPKYDSAQTLRMHCLLPGHPDAHPSMVLDHRRGFVQCRVCRYRTRNLLQLFQDSRLGWGYGQTLRELQAATSARLVPERLEAQYEDLDQHRDALRAIAWATNHHLVALLSPPPGDVNYNELARLAAAPTLQWLFEERGHKRELVDGMPYGIWPPQATLLDLCERRLVELANAAYVGGTAPSRYAPERRKKVLARVKELTASVGPEWNSAVVLVTGHDLTTPARVRIRRPDPANQKDGNILILPGYTPDEPNGYFGLYSPRATGPASAASETMRLLAVEGENDQITIAENLDEAGVHGWLVVATCGLANSTDSLLQAGFDTAYFLHDQPDPDRGRGEVWLRDRLVGCAQLQALVFNRWDALVAGNGIVKDPDDVIRLLGFDHFRAVVLDAAKTAFVACDEWAYQRAAVEAQGVDGARELTAVAARYGECVGHPAQLARYLDRISATLGLTPAVIRAQIVKGLDDETGFLRRLVDTLSHDVYFIYKEDTPKGPRAFAYHKETQRPMTFLVDSGPDIATAIANVEGDVFTYFKERVGLPAWLLDDKVEKTAPVIKELQKHIFEYLRIALQTLFRGLPTKRECEVLGLGPHVRPDPLVGWVHYYNVGTAVYKGVPRPDGTLAWSRLPGPGDGGRIFIVAMEPRYREAQSVADLEWGNSVTLDDVRGCIATLVEKVLPAWKLKHGVDDFRLIAALIADLCVPQFRDDKFNLQITGLTNSGKSTLMALFCGGQYPYLQLIDTIVYLTNYTPAGIARRFDRSTETMALDEFTADSTHPMKAQQVENITEMIRQTIFPGGARIARAGMGGVSGEVVEYHLHMNSLATSIHLPRDVQDANRRLDIETVQEKGRPDPAQAIFGQVTRTRFREIRRILNLGLYKFYPAYRETYQKIVAELNAPGFFPYKVDTRFVRNFYGPATIYALVGLDWRALVRASTEARLPSLAMYAQASANNVLFEVVLRTNAIRIGNTHTSVLALLAEGDKTPLLNATSHGVYYNEDGGYLVIDWVAMLSNGGILYRVDPYHKEPTFRLKHQLDQHATAIPWDQYGVRKVEEFMLACGNPAEPHHITVLAIGDLVKTFREKNKRRTALGEKPAAPPNPGGPPSLTALPGGADRDALPPGMRKPNRNV